MAGFEVATHGRFWVATEDLTKESTRYARMRFWRRTEVCNEGFQIYDRFLLRYDLGQPFFKLGHYNHDKPQKCTANIPGGSEMVETPIASPHAIPQLCEGEPANSHSGGQASDRRSLNSDRGTSFQAWSICSWGLGE
jgi:hypothetical protein